ncbi:MAG: MBL fold metallo-hydrolase [Ruminococcus sp.]|nr:MBL fold metallo-hydrolase [Ruminococcus sp.]
MFSERLKNRSIIKIIAIMLICVLTLCACNFDFDNNDNSDIEIKQDKLIVHYLDVGQGDSIFVELPNNETMLIDAGITNEGEGIINYINSFGYNKIDYLVATHPHADHIGSMAYIVRHMEIGKIYMSEAVATTNIYKKLLTTISDKKYSINKAVAGKKIVDEEKLSVDILAPSKIDDEILNNNSVVLMVTYKNIKFLFNGDAQKEEIGDIEGDISADVLKVGHHGSSNATTNAMLTRIHPTYAVISCGAGNEYNHPHTKTTDLLKQFGVTYLRTDELGTIVFSTNGIMIDYETNGKSIERKE